MRFAYLLSFFLLLTVVSGCKDDNDATPESPLFGVLWQATSTKIDEAGNLIYTYKPEKTIQASFGIESLRIERNGNFTRYTFGPADEGITITGTWTSADNQTFRFKPTDTKYKEASYIIESLQDSVLQARYAF